MTVAKTILLFFGMAVIGVRVLALFMGLISLVVMRLLPEPNWDGAMLLISQLLAAGTTYLIGTLALALPWYAALIAAVLVGITTYSVRAPGHPAYADRSPAYDDPYADD
jgi:hypothetical protein